ncbi:MAG: formate dehydrogenase accessory protein FdhE [Rhodocyclaceae bacterium]|nr:formate dehydrogenase accessory protein FdhE [Rhodocyclaceae bacterium]
MSAGEVPASGAAPKILIAPTDVFTRRAARLYELAQGHALGDWLTFLGALADAQQRCLQKAPAPTLPSSAQLARSKEYRMPPLLAQSLPRDPLWRAIFRCLAENLMPIAPQALREALVPLGTNADRLEAIAERVLHTDLGGEDALLQPIIASALEVYWTSMAQSLAITAITPLDVGSVCPCCGFLPVAAVLKSVADFANLRYLHCPLCNCEWHFVRAKCVSCGSEEHVSYRFLEDEAGCRRDDVRAEACDACKGYLKVINLEKSGGDPVADDLATLTLDLLMDQEGYGRIGPNLLYIPGNA